MATIRNGYIRCGYYNSVFREKAKNCSNENACPRPEPQALLPRQRATQKGLFAARIRPLARQKADLSPFIPVRIEHSAPCHSSRHL